MKYYFVFFLHFVILHLFLNNKSQTLILPTKTNKAWKMFLLAQIWTVCVCRELQLLVVSLCSKTRGLQNLSLNVCLCSMSTTCLINLWPLWCIQIVEPVDVHRLTGLGAPHTTHCLASGDVMISCIGDSQGNNTKSKNQCCQYLDLLFPQFILSIPCTQLYVMPVWHYHMGKLGENKPKNAKIGSGIV